jgi:putative cardiolipin synthase
MVRVEGCLGAAFRTLAGQLLAIGLAALLAGCATLRGDLRPQPSYAFDQPEVTSLGRAYAKPQALHPGLSGFRLINNGVSALMTRAAMADLAERSIDVQYYIFDPDESGAFLLGRLMAAAERGVQVRILLDDYPLALDEATLAAIDAHPLVEVRIFNPYRYRNRVFRSMESLFNLEQVGRRMHNKVFAVDGQIAILGGRNISNQYMEGEADANFRDIDVLAAGPVLKEVAASFDSYWNSSIVVPVAALDPTRAEAGVDSRFEALRAEAAAGHGPYAEYVLRKNDFMRRLLGADGMIWAKGRAIVEPPVRRVEGASKSSAEIARALAIARLGTSNEIVYQVAYFVPGEKGVRVLSDMVARGVRVRVLTNSLASTDVLAVHAGYARYRESLLRGGIELHEYRADAKRPEPAGHRMRRASSGSALHAKIVIHDRKLVWIGSANFDPRSRHINTESGLLIESDVLAARIMSSVERDFSLAHSWMLSLRRDNEAVLGGLVWKGEIDGKEVSFDYEPGASLLRHLGVLFYSLIPGIEDLL